MPQHDIWIDGHLDLATIAFDRNAHAPCLTTTPKPHEGAVSFASLQAGQVRACFATIYTAFGAPEQPYGYRDHNDLDGAHAAGVRQLELYEAWEQEGLVRIVRTMSDLEQTIAGEGPLAIVILMECADPIRSAAEVPWWIERGVRMIGLSWSHGSRYSGGNARDGGLTDAGRDVVAAIDDAGGAHDASHLSDAALDDLLATAKGPIASSHSNSRVLLPTSRFQTRHLRREHAEEIAKRGGVAGVNLYGKFLAEGRRAHIDDVVAHANALAESFGKRHVALGSDMDGGFGVEDLPEHLEGPNHLHALDQALADAGWSEDERTAFRTDAWHQFLTTIPALQIS